MKEITLYITFQKDNQVKYGFKAIIDDITADGIDAVIDERRKTCNYIYNNVKILATFMKSDDLLDIDKSKYMTCYIDRLYSYVKQAINYPNGTTIWIEVKKNNYI